VNTAVAGVGLGLAVPIDEVTRRIVGALMKEGSAGRTSGSRAAAGRSRPGSRRSSDASRASRSWRWSPGSAAASAGIRAEDLVLELAGVPVNDDGTSSAGWSAT
jgi:S1-C subfamily serine protease